VKVTIHHIGTNKFSLDIDVPNNCTAKEAMQNYLPSRYKKFLSQDFTLGIWGTNLDGKFLPMPESYRLNENDRIEIPNVCFKKVFKRGLAHNIRNLVFCHAHFKVIYVILFKNSALGYCYSINTCI
jgi:hypothetical protein